MQRRVICTLAAASYGLVAPAAIASQNPFLPYFFQNGGCTRSVGYGHPPIIGSKFLGKKLEDWDENDVRLFREAVLECVQLAGRRETNGPSVYVDNMLRLVNQARATRQERDREIEAQHEAERHDVEQRRVDEVISEVKGFYNHVMLPTEVERAERIKRDFPTFAAKIDGLLLAQEHLKQQAEEERKLAHEREDAARKLEAERKKLQLQQRLAAEEAKLEQEKKQEQFEESLPSSCKKSQSIENELQSKVLREKIDKASSLAEAGDTQSACPSFVELSLKWEDMRINLIKCTKDLENNSDPLAQQTASTALSDAIGIHAKQKSLAQQLKDMKCE